MIGTIRDSHSAGLSCAAIAAAALVLALAGCGGEKTAQEESLRPVRFEQVFSTGGNRFRTFSGVAQAAMESNLSFRVAGKIEQVAVSLGNKVRAGQLIARLDPMDYEFRAQEADAALKRAEAEARRSTSDYSRVRALYENRNASRNDLDAARAADESAKAAVESASNETDPSASIPAASPR